MKVYLDREYMSKNQEEKNQINKEVKTYIGENIKKYKKKKSTKDDIQAIIESKEFEFFDAYKFYYFIDLININNKIFKSTKVIDTGINTIRNSIYHHENILYYNNENKKNHSK